MPKSSAAGKWYHLDSKRIQLETTHSFAPKKNQIQRLLTRYGEWGACIVTESGEVIGNAIYAEACKAIGYPVWVRVVPDAQRDLVIESLSRQYGKFSYEHLPITTWAQSLAQKFRLRDTTVQGSLSCTYEDDVRPRLRKDIRILDFGAGQKDYVRVLSGEGYNIMGVEFYHRKDGSMELDMQEIHGDITALCESITRDGLFDMVICDSVINSVDSKQSEADVMGSLNSLCKLGGQIIFSGRSWEFTHKTENNLKTCASMKKHVYFLDDDGFSAMFQRGVWLYQKFHTKQQAHDLGTKYIGPTFEWSNKGSGWAIIGTKSHNLPWEEAEGHLAREFNLPLPNGNRHGRSEDIVKAFRIATGRATE